jgi:multiple antibiotic resistance protein
MSRHLQAIITVLSLVNPAICGVLFTRVEMGRPRGAQIADATRVAGAILAILVPSALAGVRLLEAFGVSLGAFEVAGGLVLGWMGFSMLRGPAEAGSSKPRAAGDGSSLASLILFAASPGTITGVIALSVAHSPHELPVTVLVAVGVATAVTWLAMLAFARLGGGDRGGLLRDTVTRLMGLVIVAMGVQFALTGIRSFLGTSAGGP